MIFSDTRENINKILFNINEYKSNTSDLIIDLRPGATALKISGYSRSCYMNTSIKGKGGKERIVNIPVDEIKIQQRKELEVLKSIFKLHPAATAVKGSSFISNAKEHSNASHIFKCDIKSFYPSTNLEKLDQVLLDYFPDQYEYFISHSYLFFTTIISPTINGNFGDELYRYDITDLNQCYLPTGACTSPYIANIVLYPVDDQLSTYLTSEFPTAKYTRYLDDITISFTQPLTGEQQNIVRNKVFNILTTEGWTPHPIKSRWINPNNDKYIITGVDLRTTAKVTTSYIKNNINPEVEKILVSIIDTNFVKLPAFWQRKHSNQYNTLEDIIPLFFGKVTSRLSYIKQVNPQQYNKILLHIEKRLNRLTEILNVTPVKLFNLMIERYTKSYIPIYEINKYRDTIKQPVPNTPLDAIVYSIKHLLDHKDKNKKIHGDI